MLSVRNLRKVYKSKKADDVVALDNVSIDFPETGFVFLLGKSGSGKSTLLNAIGGLDKFDGGEIIIKGKSSADFSQSDFDSYRNTFIGFIFQEYNILENFSVAKNLALALELQGKKADHEAVMNLLRQVEMEQYAKRKPNELSGGQKQRVAIARALIKNPEIIMADEPTGALDSNTGKQVMDTLKELSKTKLIIVVSHDREFAELYGDRIIELKDGKILHDITKKEIVAQETASGIKVIDNDIVYIKKGQQISDQEMKAIVNIINNKSQEADAFISFNGPANEKLKEGAKINDSGNKEKFVNTEKEDIKVKQYNPNSLNLIKSRLKFKDSFKMGASALKNKVGKLIFTIFLSFFAFTVFGIIDALSCWNRADSVYEAMQMTGQTNIAMRKGIRRESWISSEATLATDMDALQEEFPNHVIKGVVKGNYWEPEITPKEYTLKNNNNPLLQTVAGGYISISNTEAQKLGLTIIGKLPAQKNEICISQHLFNAMVSRTSENDQSEKIVNFTQFTESNPLIVRIDGFSNIGVEELKVVGIVQDDTNLDIYKDKEEEELMEMSYQISEVLNYSWARLVYVNQEAYNLLASNGSSIYYYLDFGQSSNNGWYSLNGDYNDISDEILNNFSGNSEEFMNSRGIYLKTGKNITNLAIDEIILPEYYLSNNFTDIASAIEEGLTVRLLEDTNDETAIRELKVVGYSTWGGTYVSSAGKANLDPLFAGYEFMVSSLIGNEAEDKRFITRLETVDANNVKFAVQNSTTGMLDMLEEILLMMTSVFVWIALAFAVFAALMLMNFISTSISYKKREIGVLRALGARGSDVFGIFFNESMVIAAINFVLSTIATFVICAVINAAVLSELSLEIALLNVSIRQMLLIAGVSVASAFIGSFLPTFKISRKRPIDAINNR